MGKIIEHWRIPVAALFSVVLIIGAYIFARGVGSPPAAEASAETALLQAISSKDSDNDGLHDWEESLYGTDPNKTDSLNLGMTDGEAVAKGIIVPKAVANIQSATSTTATADGTLTSAFAQDFFTLYLAAKQSNGGVDLTDDQTNVLINQALSQLSRTVTSPIILKTAWDIKVSGTGAEALRAFAIKAEAVIRKNKSDATKSEVEYLQDIVISGDMSASAHLTALSEVYRNSSSGLAALSVPQELMASHLAIVNALMNLSEIDNSFARVEADPLAAMLALQQYQDTERAVERAFTDLAIIYTDANVILQNGTPGASFVNVMLNITAQQQAAQNL